MKQTERQREIYRAKLLKVYREIEQWPVEDKIDWITLHVEEIHELFMIARREGYLEAIRRPYRVMGDDQPGGIGVRGERGRPRNS